VMKGNCSSALVLGGSLLRLRTRGVGVGMDAAWTGGAHEALL
jgi:hypothetical protein